mmetsp:Transcript_2030/g.4272  ORF Transcript_2030/g.4272 Transcript_2030/m.4272 type:complete len:139 (+) Transcript_2030:656-1072(+)
MAHRIRNKHAARVVPFINTIWNEKTHKINSLAFQGFYHGNCSSGQSATETKDTRTLSLHHQRRGVNGNKSGADTACTFPVFLSQKKTGICFRGLPQHNFSNVKSLFLGCDMAWDGFDLGPRTHGDHRSILTLYLVFLF